MSPALWIIIITILEVATAMESSEIFCICVVIVPALLGDHHDGLGGQFPFSRASTIYERFLHGTFSPLTSMDDDLEADMPPHGRQRVKYETLHIHNFEEL